MKISPYFYGLLAALVGVGLAVGGIFILAGMGWALIAGSVPCVLFACVLFRGLIIAEAAEEDEAQ